MGCDSTTVDRYAVLRLLCDQSGSLYEISSDVKPLIPNSFCCYRSSPLTGAGKSPSYSHS